MLKDSGAEATGTSILRDHLAGDRTVLANERTLLVYVHTALTFFIAGVTFVKFFDHPVIVVIGWVFIPAAVGTLALGIRSFRHNKRHIYRIVCDEFDRKRP